MEVNTKTCSSSIDFPCLCIEHCHPILFIQLHIERRHFCHMNIPMFFVFLADTTDEILLLISTWAIGMMSWSAANHRQLKRNSCWLKVISRYIDPYSMWHHYTAHANGVQSMCQLSLVQRVNTQKIHFQWWHLHTLWNFLPRAMHLDGGGGGDYDYDDDFASIGSMRSIIISADNSASSPVPFPTTRHLWGMIRIDNSLEYILHLKYSFKGMGHFLFVTNYLTSY